MADHSNALSIEARLGRLEVRVEELAAQLSQVVDAVNEPPRRSFRHPFSSIHHLHEQLGEVDEEFKRLIDELHRPA